MRKAIVASGDLHNVGDLALLLQCAHGLRSITGIKSVSVRQWVRPDPAVMAQLHKARIGYVPAKALPVRAAAGALVMWGGGQMVRDNASRASLLSLLFLTRLARWTGGRSAMIAIGASRLHNGFHQRIWRRMLRGAALVTTRDRLSQEVLQALIGNDTSVPVTADLAFLPSPLHDALRQEGARDMVIVAPCSDASEGRDVAVERMCDHVEALCARFGTDKVRILGHDARPGMDPDICKAIAGRLATRSPGLSVETVLDYRLEPYLESYRRAAVVLTNRLHAAIFTMLAGRPLVLIDDGTAKLRAAAERFAISSIAKDAALDQEIIESLLAEGREGAPAARQEALADAAGQARANFTLLAEAIR